MTAPDRPSRLGANLRQLALMALDGLPDRLVATDLYRRARRVASRTPLRFEPPDPPTHPLPRDRWTGRRLADPATELVVEGFPGSANSYLSNCLRDALDRPAVLDSHFHYTAQLRRAAAFSVPTLVVVREPAAACASLIAKEPALWPSVCLVRWIAYHRCVLRLLGRGHLDVIFFDDITRDVDLVRRRHPAVAALVSTPIEPRTEYRRPSAKPRRLETRSSFSRRLLRRAEALYRRLRAEAPAAS